MRKKILLVPVLLILSGCAFGVSELKPEYPYNVQMSVSRPDSANQDIKSVEVVPGLKVNVDWIGNAPPLATAKSVFGLVNRYVVPYTKNTTLVRIRVENNTANIVSVNPENMVLSVNPENGTYTPFNLEYFKSRWPTTGIRTQDVMLDQSYAIGEVIRTIFRQRSIEPGDAYEGILAFPLIPEASSSANLNGKLELNKKLLDVFFEFRKSEEN